MSKNINWSLDGISIIWTVTRPVSTAFGSNADDNECPIPKKIWDTKISVNKGDAVVILRDYNDNVLLKEPIRGSTLKSLFAATERGMNKKLLNTTDNAKIVYSIIPSFIKPQYRLGLAQKFEQNNLCPK